MPLLHIAIENNGVAGRGQRITIPKAIKPQKMILRNYVIELDSSAVNTASNNLFHLEIDWLNGSLMGNRNNNHFLTLSADYTKPITQVFCNYSFHPPIINRFFNIRTMNSQNAVATFPNPLKAIHLFFDYSNTTHSGN